MKNETTDTHLKTRLKVLMKEKHISGVKLAKELGVSPAYINMVASGKTELSVKKCAELAKILGVPLAALFDGYTTPGTLLCPHCGQPIHLEKD